MDSKCECKCVCHSHEAKPEWPGPCAGCCEPGDDCDCGRALFDARPDARTDVRGYFEEMVRRSDSHALDADPSPRGD